MNRADLVAQVLADLDHLDHELRWAHADGYQPGTPTNAPAKPRTTDDRPAPADPDHVPAARHDIGIGNHRRRQALHTAVTHLAGAERRLVVAAYLAGADRQPVAVAPTRASTLHDLALTIEGCRRRARLIAAGSLSRQADRQLEHAAGQLDKAWRVMSKAFDRGPVDGIASGEPMCIICSIRPRAEGRKRCETCHRWRQRNGGERPRRLDDERLATAYEAKERRARRGEGWGDESFGAVTARDRFVVEPGPAAGGSAEPTGPRVTGPPKRDLPPRQERLAQLRAERRRERST